MKLNYHFILVMILTFSFNGFSQFDSVLLKKYFSNLNNPYRNLAPFGDQNSDGYSDFIAYNCFEGKINVFFGGTHLDTIPYVKISSSDQGILSFAIIDINHDLKEDIVIRDYYDQKTKVFYGGAELDSIPDIVLDPPQGASNALGFFMKNAGDFNGDGWDDLMMYDYYLPNSNEEIGVDYFFSTYPVFDNIPEMIFCGDTLNNIKRGVHSFGDINGDGLQDFIYHGGGPADSTYFMGVVLGNAQWDTTSTLFYYQNEHQFDVLNTHFIDDINGDGKDDILINSYGNFYPYYFTESILYGSIPLDTIPDVGLNTQNDGIVGQVSVGDVNGDGYNDLLTLQGFGYPIAKLWLGGSNMNTHNLPVRGWGGSEDFFGGMINKVGDVDGDGVNEFAVGTAPMAVDCIEGYFKIFKGDTSVTTGIQEQSLPQPEGFELYDPYPNPFNPNVTVEFKLGKSSSVNLVLYDILGKEIKQIITNQQREAGKYEEVINTSELNLSSGVYVIQLQAVSDNNVIFNSSKKLNLIK